MHVISYNDKSKSDACFTIEQKSADVQGKRLLSVKSIICFLHLQLFSTFPQSNKRLANVVVWTFLGYEREKGLTLTKMTTKEALNIMNGSNSFTKVDED